MKPNLACLAARKCLSFNLFAFPGTGSQQIEDNSKSMYHCSVHSCVYALCSTASQQRGLVHQNSAQLPPQICWHRVASPQCSEVVALLHSMQVCSRHPEMENEAVSLCCSPHFEAGSLAPALSLSHLRLHCMCKKNVKANPGYTLMFTGCTADCLCICAVHIPLFRGLQASSKK